MILYFTLLILINKFINFAVFIVLLAVLAVEDISLGCAKLLYCVTVPFVLLRSGQFNFKFTTFFRKFDYFSVTKTHNHTHDSS